MLSILVALVALTAAYALVTTSFVLVLKATNAVNFAHGDFVMIGGYAAWQLGTWFDVPGLVLLPLVLVLMMGVGLVAWAWLHRRWPGIGRVAEVA